MDPVLQEIYSTVVPSMPYIIAAFVLVLVILFVFLFRLNGKLKREEERLRVLEERLSRAAVPFSAEMSAPATVDGLRDEEAS